MDQLKMTNRKIIISTFVNREIEYVWHLWTTPEGMKKFLGVDAKIDMTPLGAYELYFDPSAKPGNRGGETNRVLSFVPNRMLSFTWNAPPSIPFVRDHPYKTWVVITMNAIDDKQTLVELTHLGWPQGDAWDEAYAYFEKAWASVIDRLSQM